MIRSKIELLNLQENDIYINITNNDTIINSIEKIRDNFYELYTCSGIWENFQELNKIEASDEGWANDLFDMYSNLDINNINAYNEWISYIIKDKFGNFENFLSFVNNKIELENEEIELENKKMENILF